MAGQGTVGLEMLEDAPEADVVLVQVGGGGLVSGIATAVKAMKPDVARDRDRAGTFARAAREPRRPASRSRSRRSRSRTASTVPMQAPTAFGSAPSSASSRCSSPRQALEEAFRFMYGRMKLACEVAGAATAAALLSGAFVPEPGQTVAAVVSGGNVAAKTAAAILNADEA